jgi:CheY-like chemotaxis protein
VTVADRARLRAPTDASHPGPAPAAPAPAVKLPPPWILIAADDPIIRDVWTAELLQAGFPTASARDGAETLERLQTVLPDLMILELRMSELSGTAVRELIRLRPTLARIPVLIISGFLDEEPVLERGLHIVGRLAKPQSLVAVVEAVRAVLATRPGA